MEVQTGEVRIGTGATVLRSEGIGSCVVIAAWDSKRKVGAMAHVMLPARGAHDPDHGCNVRYADDAMDALLREMGHAGTDIRDIEVSLVGGANVLNQEHDTVGRDNIESIMQLLNDRGIRIAARSLGGTERRSVSLDVEAGTVRCAVGEGKEEVLWRWAEGSRVQGVEGCSNLLEAPRDPRARAESLPLPAGAQAAEAASSEEDRRRILDLEKSQRACLNIMQDLENKRKELENVQKAYLNIMRDMEQKNAQLEGSRKALMNMMQDLAAAKKVGDDLNATLEQKVAERTRELQESTMQLIQSEKLSALGELTAGVAHELNQPLNVIKIIAQSLLRDLSKSGVDKEACEADLRDVVSQINKMAAIITHMRVFTRNTIGDAPQSVDLNAVIENALKFHEQQLSNHNIKLSKELQGNLPTVLGDPIRLEQVVVNFLTNAKDALEKQQDKRLTISTSVSEDKKVVVEVRDSGCGIPEQVMKKIFNPFFTTKEVGKGTGLGLSVAKKIIEEHKGTVEVESTVGAGTLFRIRLPGN